MSSNGDNSTPSKVVKGASDVSLVTRTNVPAGLKYTEYRSYLRYDFFHSCAYCTTTEAEAQAIRFTIDHYVPQGARPDLVDEYANLMYACDECNQRKGDRDPPLAAQSAGYRFYRPDMDKFDEHFRIGLSGILINPESKTGEYTIEALDLNRHMLKRIRDIRQRLMDCNQFVAEGIRALRNSPIDKLPTNMKAQAAKAIKEATSIAGRFPDEIDNLLRSYAKSELIDGDTGPEEEARLKEREEKLRNIHSLFPVSWRAPRKKKSKGK